MLWKSPNSSNYKTTRRILMQPNSRRGRREGQRVEKYASCKAPLRMPIGVPYGNSAVKWSDNKLASDGWNEL